jgi:hypothetical protein
MFICLYVCVFIYLCLYVYVKYSFSGPNENKLHFGFVLYCNSLLTKHITHDKNIMHNILKGHNLTEKCRGVSNSRTFQHF